MRKNITSRKTLSTLERSYYYQPHRRFVYLQYKWGNLLETLWNEEFHMAHLIAKYSEYLKIGEQM